MRNLEILKSIVGTNYNDMFGLIAIDSHSGTDLFTLCEDHGINMEKYFLLGFGLSEFTLSGIGEENSVYCYVLLLDRSKYGRSYDEIQQAISGLENVDIIKKSFEIKYTDLKKYIKRFDFMTISTMGDHISEMNIIEE